MADPQSNEENQEQSFNCPLTNIDFWPQCLLMSHKVQHAGFDDFNGVLQKVNEWLCANQKREIVTIETTRKKVYLTAEIYEDGCKYDPGRHISSSWVHGIRLWVRSRDHRSVQTLAYVDVTPSEPSCERLNELVDKFNCHIQTEPLDGEIISINTVTVSSRHTKLDPQCTAYSDDAFIKCRHFFLRIFYLKGLPSKDAIGTADFTPRLLKDAGIFKAYPDFQPLNVAMEKAKKWISENKGIRVTNIQTVDTGLSQGASASRLNTQQLYGFGIEGERDCRILFIRVAYVIPSDPSRITRVTPNVVQIPFFPRQLRQGKVLGSSSVYEDISDTVMRAMRWLNSTGARVLCAETAIIQERALFTKENIHATEFTGEWFTTRRKNGPIQHHRHTLLQIIKIYLEQPVDTEPDMIMPKPAGCTIL